ncbi:MAG: hypothetical protein NC311_02195 [Muribaculaceae bacterium]|nr:hypothetical protein [Muribaculaceae bacterium]
MFNGEFKFDLHDALMARGAQYCRAYHATNEPITNWLSLMRVQNPRVLTVAASGDQPLLHAATGASHVDTFDITVNACAVMDFKTSALQTTANLDEYQDAVQNLTRLDGVDKIGTRQHAAFMRIVDNMPMRTRPLMQKIINTYCNQTAFSQHVSRKLRFPTDTAQFAKMRACAHTPLDFIWADLINVHHYIEGEYDIINVSNIFDHYLWYKDSPKSVFDAIKSLWPHLRDGGYMLCTSTDNENLRTVRLISTMIRNLHADVSINNNPALYPWMAIVFQKTR